MEQNLTTIIIANLVLAAGYIIDFIVGFKFNEKKTVIKFNILSSSCSMASNIILCAYGGAMQTIITIIRLTMIYVKEELDKKWHVLFVIFVFLYATSLLDWRGIYSIMLFAGALCSFVPKWYSKDVQKLRIGALFGCFLTIPYCVVFNLYTGVFFLVFNIVTLTINIFKWSRKNSIKQTGDKLGECK